MLRPPLPAAFLGLAFSPGREVAVRRRAETRTSSTGTTGARTRRRSPTASCSAVKETAERRVGRYPAGIGISPDGDGYTWRKISSIRSRWWTRIEARRAAVATRALSRTASRSRPMGRCTCRRGAAGQSSRFSGPRRMERSDQVETSFEVGAPSVGARAESRRLAGCSSHPAAPTGSASWTRGRSA